MEVLEGRLAEHVETILCSLRGDEARAVEPPAPGDRAAGCRITSCVHVSGTWQGAVTAECGYGMAVAVAAAMFELEPDELSEDEVRDAFGEVANLLAGQFKLDLPDGCALSLPTVTKGEDYLVNVPGSKLVQRTCVRQAGECLTASVFERK